MHENDFLQWVYSIDPGLIGFNPGSTQQMQQLMFGPCYRKINNQNKEMLMKRAIISDSDQEVVSINDEEEVDEDENLKIKSNRKKKAEKEVLIVPPVRVFKIDNEHVGLILNLFRDLKIAKARF